MKSFWILCLRWLKRDIRSVLCQESVMGKLIAFYIPINFRKTESRWTPPEQRGKVLAFARARQKPSAARTVNPWRTSPRREIRLS